MPGSGLCLWAVMENVDIGSLDTIRVPSRPYGCRVLALREMLRSKARFGLLSGAVGLLVFLILFQQALLSGLVNDFVGAVDNQNAPVLVFNEQARQNVEGSFLFADQETAVAAVDGVAEAGPIGQNTYTVDAGAELRDAVLFGYELGRLGEPQTLIEGRLPAGPGEAVASAADADLGFDIGDTVVVIGTGNPEITVVGLADSIRWSVAPTLFVSYETFESTQRAVNPDAAEVLASLMAVAPEPGLDIDVLTDRIDATVPGVEALTRQEAVDQNPGVEGVRQSFNIILGLAFLVVTLVVGFFFLILTVQKAQALTLLRAVGAPSSYLVKNVIIQILLVLGLGSAIGVLATFLVVALAPTGDLSVSVDAGTVIPTIVGLAFLSLLGGIAAIRRVLRIDPIMATTSAGAAT